MPGEPRPDIQEKRAKTVQRIQVVFKGEVQGVGFRYTVQSLALKYRLCGWVKNMPDGSTVMAEVQGSSGQIEALIRDVQREFTIRDLEKKPLPVSPEENDFRIRF